MFAEYWTSSIGLRGISSGGLLRHGFTAPFSPSTLGDDEAALDEVHTVLFGTVNSPSQDMSFWSEQWGEDAVKRLLGCAMISVMPEAGLEEALVSLKDIAEFYSENARLALPQPLTSRSTGRVVSTSERPELVISE